MANRKGIYAVVSAMPGRVAETPMCDGFMISAVPDQMSVSVSAVSSSRTVKFGMRSIGEAVTGSTFCQAGDIQEGDFAKVIA